MDARGLVYSYVHLRMRYFVFCWLGIFMIKGAEIKTIRFSGQAQGTTYQVTYFATDSIIRQQQVDSIFRKIDSSLSLYKPYSLVNRFNESAVAIDADGHLTTVVKKALKVYRKTKGDFDITVYPLTNAWGFGPVKRTALPDSVMIRSLLPLVDSRLVRVEGNKIYKKNRDIKLDPNGIAQGYTVDVIAGFFEQNGIYNYIIELGGEIRVRGRKPGGRKMSIGIEQPSEDGEPLAISRVIYPGEGAITTSGNYKRFIESGGKKLSHLINTHTGYPLDNELISVTVYAPDAITADAYDNAIMVMGLKRGLRFVNRHRELAAYFIFHRPDGSIGDTMTKRFRMLLTDK